MVTRLVHYAAVLCSLLISTGSAQPNDCGANFTVSGALTPITIVPFVRNCFICIPTSATTTISWRVETGNGFGMVGQDSTPFVELASDGTTLVIPEPQNYVGIGFLGRRTIICSNAHEARLTSPLLLEPEFDNVTVIEDDTLKLICNNNNAPGLSSVQIFGADDSTPLAIDSATNSFTVGNVTRNYSGIYECRLLSTVNSNFTVSSTAFVTIQYGPELTMTSPPNQDLPLNEPPLTLRCEYDGVPTPTAQWLHNGTTLSDGVNGVNIATTGYFSELRISSLLRNSGGVYVCNVTNVVNSNTSSFTILILIPPAPVTLLTVERVDETEIDLSWSTGFNGFTPITNITVDVNGGGISRTDTIEGNVNTTTIGNLIPFQQYTFTVSVVNRVGLSDGRQTPATTLSLKLSAPVITSFIAESSTNIVLRWEPPPFNSITTDAPDNYTVEFSGTPSTQTISAANQLVVNFTGLAKGTSFSASVVGVNVRGPGNFSSTSTVETLVDPPSQPQNLTVKGVGATVLFICWEPPADNGGRPVLEYILTLANISENITNPEQRTLLIRNNGLVENTTYTVSLAAANVQGLGSEAVQTGTTQSILEPQQIFDIPDIVEDMVTNNSALVSWEYPGGDVDVYTIRYDLSVSDFANAQEVNSSGNVTTARITDLLPGSTYEFQVAVVNSRGMSAFSMSGSFSTLAPDPPVITSSNENPVTEGSTVTLTCISALENPAITWRVDGRPDLPSNAMLRANNLSLTLSNVMASNAADYICEASVGSVTSTQTYTLSVIPPVAPSGIDQIIIIVVATVGGVALLIFLFIVLLAVCCFVSMKKKGHKQQKYELKQPSNANWIETSVHVPRQGKVDDDEEDRTGATAAFPFPDELQTHSSFNTLEKDKVHSTATDDVQPATTFSSSNDKPDEQRYQSFPFRTSGTVATDQPPTLDTNSSTIV